MGADTGLVFPIEVFEDIIDRLVESCAAIPGKTAGTQAFQRVSSLRLLQTCALVCKAFLPSCRRHIFRSIDTIGFYDDSLQSFPGTSLAKLLRLIKVLQGNPALCSFVKELHLVVERTLAYDQNDKFFPGMITPEELKECNAVLTQFHNLTHLSINYCRYKTISTPKYPRSLTGMCSSLLQLYLQQRTLRSLQIYSVGHADLSNVFRSPLQKLTLIHKAIPSFSLPTFHDLSDLKVISSPSLPLSLFKHLPSLIYLHIQVIDDCPDIVHDDDRAPSFMLNRLSLDFRKMGLLPKFAQFYFREGEVAKLQPFSRLSNMKLFPLYSDDYSAAGSLLKHTPNLKSLLISEFDPGPIPSLELENAILQVCPGLTTLILSLTARRQSTFELLMEYLRLVFSSISSRNNIAILELNLGIRYLSDVPTLSPSVNGDLWIELSRILASPHGFPLLGHIKIDFNISSSVALRYNISTSFLDLKMMELKARLKSNFLSEVYVF
ncbi:hypothetical protein BJ165DRAFT_1607383 [Panaeolus papilionaceus]|nr:hypothetical protein BJ165DRAFT_1607383 [Panaeolus papilionaceus]